MPQLLPFTPSDMYSYFRPQLALPRSLANDGNTADTGRPNFLANVVYHCCRQQRCSIFMRALFTSFPASDYETSTRFYEQAVGLKVIRGFDGKPHRFKNYDLGGLVLKVYEWTEKYYGHGHTGLFIETDDHNGVVNRIRKFGGKTTEIVVHQ